MLNKARTIDSTMHIQIWVDQESDLNIDKPTIDMMIKVISTQMMYAIPHLKSDFLK